VRPTVSVVITAFQREKYLRESVFSAVRQTDLPEEVVVVKTAAPPGDPDLSLLDTATRVIEAPDDATPGGMYRLALEATRGDVICFLDDDDCFAPGKIEAVRRAFRVGGSNLAGVRNGCAAVDEGMTAEIPGWAETHPQAVERRLVGGPGRTRSDYAWLVRHSTINNSTYSLRRSALERVRDALPGVLNFTDHFLLLAALSAGSLWMLPENLTVYRFHGGAHHVGSGRANAEDLRLWMSWAGSLPSIGLSPLASLLWRDSVATNPVALARQGGRRPTAREWAAYARFVARRRQLYLARDGLRVMLGSREAGT